TALEVEARLYRIGINVHPWSEVHNGLTSAAILDRKCVAIGISNTGRTEETIPMLTVAKGAGARTGALTGHPEARRTQRGEAALIRQPAACSLLVSRHGTPRSSWSIFFTC